MKKTSLLIALFSLIFLTGFAQEEIKRVAILETVDKLGSVPYLKLLQFRSNLTSAITETKGYEGYDRADLKQILGEQNFQRTGLVSDADIKKIGEFTGAQYVLIAEAAIDGNDMFITAKIIDVETARVIRNSNQLMGTSAAEMQEGSQKVAADLLRRQIEESPPINNSYEKEQLMCQDDYNAALFLVLNKNYLEAKEVIARISPKDAKTYYLAAVLASRMKEEESVYRNLIEAIKLDNAFKTKAKKDYEFEKFRNTPEFQEIVR